MKYLPFFCILFISEAFGECNTNIELLHVIKSATPDQSLIETSEGCPHLIKGDFNSDGILDFATLLTSQPSNSYPYVASAYVFLQRNFPNKSYFPVKLNIGIYNAKSIRLYTTKHNNTDAVKLKINNDLFLTFSQFVNNKYSREYYTKDNLELIKSRLPHPDEEVTKYLELEEKKIKRHIYLAEIGKSSFDYVLDEIKTSQRKALDNWYYNKGRQATTHEIKEMSDIFGEMNLPSQKIEKIIFYSAYRCVAESTENYSYKLYKSMDGNWFIADLLYLYPN